MSTTTVRIERGSLQLPSELHFLMAGVPQIALVERRGYFYVWPYDFNFIARHRRLFARFKLGRADNVRLFDFAELRSDVAIYRGRDSRASGPEPAEGEYGVVDKVTNFLLMPLQAAGGSEAGATERFWQSLDGYHEHLSAERQAGFAQKISAWFADDVLRPLDPQSVLEVGCGGGRNLVYAHRALPATRMMGIDINPRAVQMAIDQLGPGADVRQGSLYQLGQFADDSVDAVFSMGVLMHIAHDRVPEVVAQMQRIARLAVIHLECHGPSYGFDYHKYPRNYEELYRRIGGSIKAEYTVFPHADFRSRESAPFYMALLTGRK
jgi:SAM-dependent methyltransferase